MTENNLTYYCPICINDFTDEGVKPFYCLHILCDACTEQYKNSSLIYKCPLCKSEPKPNMKYNITKKLKTAQAADFLASEMGMTPGGSKGGGGGSAGGSGSGSGSSNVAPATQNSTGAASTTGSNKKMLQIIINIAENLEQVGAITPTKSYQIANSDNIQAQLQIIVPIIRSILENKAQNGPEIVN